ncbi:secretin N-terminal domain-containing protein [Piscinibacter gummiphilus]|uniref:Uncharacterized protein n=1 Tax=Piscinibacter gummiphilus TaxID=946333 RepID=A0A1W6LGE5_9BURK|nr:secretin N-terminal domain-containing protein [Piscinibacter gummiphilus]ARN23335.1 hypothetical protein A4W93_27425 [Piscinibacter gummiphilus]ATU68036.1 general secretion pathway protein GspD [Piscinibacter gummiphilus]GLS97334.1 hypothetical protein GCM10007918_46260 [Piscinibacter gummiphilus]
MARRDPKRALVAVVAGLLAACATPPPEADLEPAKAALAEGRLREGYLDLAARAARHPADAPTRVWLARARDRYTTSLITGATQALQSGQPDQAEPLFRELATVPGFEARARDGLQRVAAARAPAAELRLDHRLSAPAADPAMQRRVSLQFRDAPVRSVFDVIGRTAQVAIVFDRDVPPDLKVSVSLRDTTVAAALDKVARGAGLAHRLDDDGTVLVYPDLPRKQADYQGLVVRSFYLTHVDARFMAQSLKTVLRSRDIVVDPKINMIVLRDTPEGLRLAEQLVRMHDVAEPEVMLEVEVLEVKRTLLQQLGIDWPSQLSLSPLPMQLQVPGMPFDRNLPVTLRDVLNLRSSSVEAALGSLTVHLRREDGDVNTLATPRLRARNREKARIMIGERVPNITSTSTSTGFVAESVNYVDVGLKLEIEPQVYAGGEVVIKVGLEVSSLLDQTQTRSGSTAYRISTRNANTVLRLRDGENQLLAGLIQDEDLRQQGKVPGLGEMPVVGRLFTAQRDQHAKTEIVLSITPRLIRPLPVPSAGDSSFRLGTASGIRGRMEDAPPDDAPEAVEAPAADKGGERPQVTR